MVFGMPKKMGPKGLEEILARTLRLSVLNLKNFFNFLATVGSNAPFIGLLGTVFGIMDAFRGLAQSQGDATAVMLGISRPRGNRYWSFGGNSGCDCI